MSSGYQGAWLDVHMFNVQVFNKELLQANLEEFIIIHHGGSELCKEL